MDGLVTPSGMGRSLYNLNLISIPTQGVLDSLSSRKIVSVSGVVDQGII